MKTEIIKHDVEIPYLVEKPIKRKSHKLERMLHRFGSTKYHCLQIFLRRKVSFL